jgi:hypothetical protein
MEGGRFLGSGTYGCAFTPPLLCDTDTKKRQEKGKGKVGKITLGPLALQEMLIGERIRRVPLASHYFLLPEPESCKPAPQSEQKEPGLKECASDFAAHRDKLNVSSMTQIFEPFGGTRPFYQLFGDGTTQPKHFDFLHFMKHILEAGSILLLAGVCHFDLHPGNLLIGKHNIVRVLDFGLSFPTNAINDLVVNGRWKRLRFGFESDAAHPSVHNSEAPEITIMNAIRRHEYSVDNAIKMTVLGKDVFKDMEKYLGVTRESSRDDLLQFFQTSQLARQRNFVMLWRTYWPGFDSWSFASILLDTLKHLLLVPEFVNGPFRTKKVAIMAALRGMLEPNPKDRLDCIEALSVFDPGSPWISRFGEKWLAARKQQRKQ